MFGQDRDQLRRFFLTSWEKHGRGEPLQPLERLIADIVARHPEYHALLADPDAALSHEASPDGGQTNPFLHMAMHITLAEQLQSDRPPGFRPLYQQITAACGDDHRAEHHIMECLGQVLWQAQRDGRQPDEAAYLACLRALADRLAG